MAIVDNKTWILAAHGELGDVVYWEPKFEPIEHARYLLCLLEEVGEDQVDWKSLLSCLPNLEILESMDFPPLYVERAFDEIDGFLTIEDEPVIERPGASFNRIEIYVARADACDLLREFSELSRRLSEYEPLKPYL
jgi:hypothetical protein